MNASATFTESLASNKSLMEMQLVAYPTVTPAMYIVDVMELCAQTSICMILRAKSKANAELMRNTIAK
eukprot:937535-Ditylum_brightwellii.AAC.1